MDTTVTTIFVVSVIGLFFFLVLHLRGGKKQVGAIRAQRIFARKKIAVDKKEVINNQFIGLDRKNQLLLFCDFDSDEEGVAAIPFDKIAYYKLNKQQVELVHRGRNRTVSEMLPDKISLLLFTHKRNRLFEFVFFDPEKNEFNELAYFNKRAEHWEKIIKKTGAVEMAW
jgi:hypothetical protein